MLENPNETWLTIGLVTMRFESRRNARVAYVSSKALAAGDIVPIINVLELPLRFSRSIDVRIESRNGMWLSLRLAFSPSDLARGVVTDCCVLSRHFANAPTAGVANMDSTFVCSLSCDTTMRRHEIDLLTKATSRTKIGSSNVRLPARSTKEMRDTVSLISPVDTSSVSYVQNLWLLVGLKNNKICCKPGSMSMSRLCVKNFHRSGLQESASKTLVMDKICHLKK
jgi:hypothetical protein